MAIIFNILPPDESTINVEKLLPGSFFRPVGNTQLICCGGCGMSTLRPIHDFKEK